MKKRLLLLVICMCIIFSACSKPQTGNDDSDTLQNTNTHEISDSVSAPDSDTYPDTSFHSADTDYPRAIETDDPSMINEISNDIITQLKKDFITYLDISSYTTLDDVVIRKYLGTYQNDYIAVSITVLTLGYITVDSKKDIAGYHFVYPSTETLYIYHESTFSEIKEAYENGIISEEDVASIYNEHNLYLTEHYPYLKK